MSNTEETRKLLEKALRSMPNDFKLVDAHSHVKKALHEISKVDKKRSKRTSGEMTPRQKWEFDLQTSSLVNPMDAERAENALAAIDRMIEAEAEKLQNMKSDDINNSDVFLD